MIDNQMKEQIKIIIERYNNRNTKDMTYTKMYKLYYFKGEIP